MHPAIQAELDRQAARYIAATGANSEFANYCRSVEVILESTGRYSSAEARASVAGSLVVVQQYFADGVPAEAAALQAQQDDDAFCF